MKQIKLSLFTIRTVFHSSGLHAVITVLCYLLSSFLPALTTWAVQNTIETVTAGSGSSVYIRFMLITVVVYALTYLSQTLLAISLNAGVFERSNAFCRRQLAEKVASFDLIRFEDYEFLNRRERAMNCVQNEVFGMTFMLVIQSLCSLISVISVAFVLARYNTIAALFAFMAALPYFFVRLIRGKAMYKVVRKNTPQMRLVSYLYSLFFTKNSARDIRMLHAGSYLADKWKSAHYDIRNKLISENKKELVSTTFCELLSVLGLLAAIYFSLRYTMLGIISVGTFCACIYAFQNIQSATLDFFSKVGTIPQQLSYVNDYVSVFSEGRQESASVPVDVSLESGIFLKQVSFRYPQGNRDAVKDLNLFIPAGKTTAVVGKNGSGKTTLSKLITGSYSPDKGKVFWDSTDISSVKSGEIERHFAVVSQPLNKFKFAVIDSLDLSCTEMNTEKATEVLNTVGLQKLTGDDMLRTNLGKEFDGIELSEGEWQELAIARCMYKNAPLVILDEPTSALDPLKEQSLLMDYIRASEGKTSVIITHRLGICRKVDNIIVMDNGSLIQQGTHDELMAQDGPYRDLFLSQQSWYNA
jgi:ABC-type multidrug transport system fused ATPase/permease subunit